MKLLRIFGLIFNVLLFLIMALGIYINFIEDGHIFDFETEKAVSFIFISLLVSSFFPTIFIKQIVGILMRAETGISTSVDILDQDLDSIDKSSQNITPQISDFGIVKFWIVFSGAMQFGLSIFLFWMLLDKINYRGFEEDNMVALALITCLLLSSIISLLYLKK